MEGEQAPEAPVKKSPEQYEKDKIVRALDSIGLMMQNLTKGNEHINPEDTHFKVDAVHLSLTSTHPRTGMFAFEGELTKGSAFPELNSEENYIPDIKNIAIPAKTRLSGVAKSLINSWEGTLSANGYHTFIVTNVSGPEQVKFWESVGYQMPKGETKPHAPYFMFKKKD